MVLKHSLDFASKVVCHETPARFLWILPVLGMARLPLQATERCCLIVQQMAQAEGITEELKAADPVRWVQAMNSIRSRAEGIIQAEMIYV